MLAAERKNYHVTLGYDGLWAESNPRIADFHTFIRCGMRVQRHSAAREIEIRASTTSEGVYARFCPVGRLTFAAPDRKIWVLAHTEIFE